MSHLEDERAHAEAKAAATLSSAQRAHLWAGLNRYLAAEAKHEHKVAEQERKQERPEKD